MSGAKKISIKKPENGMFTFSSRYDRRVREDLPADGEMIHVYHVEFHRALASTALLRPQLAKSLLGWEARKAPLGDGMLRYYRAWLATEA